MSTEDPGQPKLSKNQLKKLAKKAEKQAKKDGTAAPNTAPPADACPTSAAPKAAASTNYTLVNPVSTDHPSTLKAVWSASLTGTALSVSRRADGGTRLSYRDDEIGGGGNAMAVALFGSSTSTVTDVFVDEWCEWERIVLRPAVRDAKLLPGAMDHLNTALQGQATLVATAGGKLTAADVCVLVTLRQVDGALPSAVKRFVTSYPPPMEELDALLPPKLDLNALIEKEEHSLLKIVTTIFQRTVQDQFGVDLSSSNFVKECGNVKHGDYQCTAAMPVFGRFKGQFSSPDQVAQQIVDALGLDHEVLMDLTSQKGFVLCRLRPSFLGRLLERWVLGKGTEGSLPPYPRTPNKTCVVDFSSPNIAKEMHVGHLRSTIIGEAVCRLLEFTGANVHRVNHTGDWGTQFGMLIQYLREISASTEQDGKDGGPNITDLTAFYKAAKKRFDQDADFKKQSQQNVVQLQSGDPECTKIWHNLCDISRSEFSKVYGRLDVTVKECGESFYNDKIPAVIDELNAAGKITIVEGGAKCVFLGDPFKIPLMMQKSDGGYGYDSTDMAALKYRLQTLKADRIIIITDFTQGDHFKMIFQAGNDIGWVSAQELNHIGFGTVMGEDGKRFKTRDGDTVRLVDLLDEAVERMQKTLRERISAGKANISLEDVHTVSEAIGYGAIKYFDLRRNPASNYKFSYDQMLSTTGDTAVYLLYARVRLESILSKAAADFGTTIEDLVSQTGAEIVIGHAAERNLAWNLQKFGDAIGQTLLDLYPCHICEYAYKVALAASDFCTQCKVLGSPEMESRLLLCHAAVVALKQSFDLLGIRHVKRI